LKISVQALPSGASVASLITVVFDAALPAVAIKSSNTRKVLYSDVSLIFFLPLPRINRKMPKKRNA
jgi:hypothetical protein